MSITLCASWAPIPFDWVPSGLKLRQSRVLCDLYGPSCFLHWAHCLSLRPICLDFLGMQELLYSVLCLPSAPFVLITLGGFSSTSVLFSIFTRINRRALVLTGIVFCVKSYWVYHFAGHICNKCIVRLASSKVNTC